MQQRRYWGIILCGIAAGTINGLFGGGGGMVLVPLLTLLAGIKDENVFPTSVVIILPICLVSLSTTLMRHSVSLQGVLPFLAGSVLGGIGVGIFGKKIHPLWLHRCLGVLILWGGIRYLC